MDTQQLRNIALSTPRKQADADTPFWPGTEGKIAFVDIPTDEIIELRKVLMEERKDPAAFSAALLCRALISKETGERIFQDADRDAVAKMGSSVIAPLASDLAKFLGIDVKTAVELAKNG